MTLTYRTIGSGRKQMYYIQKKSFQLSISIAIFLKLSWNTVRVHTVQCTASNIEYLPLLMQLYSQAKIINSLHECSNKVYCKFNYWQFHGQGQQQGRGQVWVNSTTKVNSKANAEVKSQINSTVKVNI